MYRDMLPNQVCKHLGEVHPLTFIDSFMYGEKIKLPIQRYLVSDGRLQVRGHPLKADSFEFKCYIYYLGRCQTSWTSEKKGHPGSFLLSSFLGLICHCHLTAWLKRTGHVFQMDRMGTTFAHLFKSYLLFLLSMVREQTVSTVQRIRQSRERLPTNFLVGFAKPIDCRLEKGGGWSKKVSAKRAF